MAIRQQTEIPTLEVIGGSKVEGVTAEYSGKPLNLSCSKLSASWANGFISEESYIYFALMIDAPNLEPGAVFDYYEFQDNWTTTVEDKNGKEKEKTPKISTIRKVLDKLHEQALANVNNTTQLTLNFERL